MIRKIVLGATVAAGIGLAGVPASAHHAVNAQFDVTKEASLEGVLTKLDNINPHTYWYFTVKDASGKAQSWALESVGAGSLRRAGLKLKDDIQVGRTFTVYFNPSRDSSTTGLMRGLLFNGKRINFTADYITP